MLHRPIEIAANSGRSQSMSLRVAARTHSAPRAGKYSLLGLKGRYKKRAGLSDYVSAQLKKGKWCAILKGGRGQWQA